MEYNFFLSFRKLRYKCTDIVLVLGTTKGFDVCIPYEVITTINPVHIRHHTEIHIFFLVMRTFKLFHLLLVAVR